MVLAALVLNCPPAATARCPSTLVLANSEVLRNDGRALEKLTA